MTSQRWRRVQEVFDAAVRVPLAGRERFIEERCGGDEALYREVSSLLACDQRAEHFLETPAIEAVAAPTEAAARSRFDLAPSEQLGRT